MDYDIQKTDEKDITYGTKYEVGYYDWEENVNIDNTNPQQLQKIDAARGSVTLNGRLEYRVGTNVAETMAKEMYVLHVEPIIGELIYYNYDTNDVGFAEDIVEIDVSELYDEVEPGKYDGRMVTIEGEIWPTMNSYWFNSFAIGMESIEFMD